MENVQHLVNSLLKQSTGTMVILDIGCGPSKLNGSIGIDFLPYKGVDLVGDACTILREFPDNSVDYLYTKHFLEHVNDLDSLVSEFCRVLKDESQAKIIVPHFSNPYFYSDPTHKRHFGLYSFCYYSFSDHLFKRKVPTYMCDLNFYLINVDLHFQTPKGNLVRSALKKVIQIFVNRSSFSKEIYEELFCYLFPCYEVVYSLVKRRRKSF
jgi:ubiquinone/menaquinone biosynthesis C-methylase UbiE